MHRSFLVLKNKECEAATCTPKGERHVYTEGFLRNPIHATGTANQHTTTVRHFRYDPHPHRSSARNDGGRLCGSQQVAIICSANAWADRGVLGQVSGFREPVPKLSVRNFSVFGEFAAVFHWVTFVCPSELRTGPKVSLLRIKRFRRFGGFCMTRHALFLSLSVGILFVAI